MPKVVKWFPAEELPNFLETIREGTKAVIAVRESDGAYYEIITGHLPYNASNENEWKECHLFAPFPSISNN
jgi:hypothetical protein